MSRERQPHEFFCSSSKAWDEKNPIDPEASHAVLWSGSFGPGTFNPWSLLEHIENGYKFTPCTFQKGSRREETFILGDLLVLDFDGGNHVLNTFADHPITSMAMLIYGTPSWNENNRRWRLVFRLSESIRDIQRWRYAAEGLFLRCSNLDGLDPASKKPTQPYAGSRRARAIGALNPGNVLSLSDVDYLVHIGTPPPPPPITTTYHSNRWDEFIHLLQCTMQERGATAFTRDGWSNAIRCPFKNHQHDAISPAGYWNRESHCFTCFKCSQTWNAKQTGEAVGVFYE
jgi:hypothetical protein